MENNEYSLNISFSLSIGLKGKNMDLLTKRQLFKIQEELMAELKSQEYQNYLIQKKEDQERLRVENQNILNENERMQEVSDKFQEI